MNNNHVLETLLTPLSATPIRRSAMLARSKVLCVAQLLTYDEYDFLRLPNAAHVSFKNANQFVTSIGYEMGCLKQFREPLKTLSERGDIKDFISEQGIVGHLERHGFPHDPNRNAQSELMTLFKKAGLSATELEAILKRPGNLEEFSTFIRSIDGKDPSP